MQMTDRRSDSAPAPRRSTRREEILAVAARVIAERGLAGATVRDIGQAAGILSGSLYHHFESKEQIVLDLLLDNVTATVVDARNIVAEAPTAKAAMTDLIRASVKETATHPLETLILRNETRAFAELPALGPLAELRRQSVEIWVETVAKGVAEGEFRADIDIEVAVMAIVDGVLGSARWFVEGRNGQVDRVTDTLLALHLNGLLNKPRP
jgi:AcrR family transcriptional regulator